MRLSDQSNSRLPSRELLKRSFDSKDRNITQWWKFLEQEVSEKHRIFLAAPLALVSPLPLATFTREFQKYYPKMLRFPYNIGGKGCVFSRLEASSRGGEFTQPLPPILWEKRYTPEYCQYSTRW